MVNAPTGPPEPFAIEGGAPTLTQRRYEGGLLAEPCFPKVPNLGVALRGGSSAGIDGEIHAEPEFVAVTETTEVYFLAPVVGG